MSRIAVGDLAPDFNAPGTGDRNYSLSEYRGRPVVLAFYPGDATPVCTAQLSAYTEHFDKFQALDAHVLALSPQNVASHEKFSAAHNFAFPLLYDEDKKIGMTYGVVGPIGFYRRSVFVIDASGKVVYAVRGTPGLGYPSVDSIVAALGSANAAA